MPAATPKYVTAVARAIVFALGVFVVAAATAGPPPKYVVAEWPDGRKAAVAGADLTAEQRAAVDTIFPPLGEPPPAVVPPPPPPAVVRQAVVAPASGPRRYGLYVDKGGPVVVRDKTFRGGWGQNIAVQHAPSLLVENVVSVDSWRDDPAWAYGGQGLYTDDVDDVRVLNSAFGRNGWQAGRADNERTVFRHNNYHNFDDGNVTIDGCIYYDAPNSGIQVRGPRALVTSTTVLNCGIGILASQGVTDVENCVIYGGSFSFVRQKDGTPAWTGMVAVSSDAIVNLRHILIVARPGQERGDAATQSHAGRTRARRYFGPALSANWKASDPSHPQWRPPPRGAVQINCEDVHVFGWPGGRKNMVGGNGVADGAGVTWHDAPVEYDYRPVVAEVEAGRLSAREGSARIMADVRRMAGLN